MIFVKFLVVIILILAVIILVIFAWQITHLSAYAPTNAAFKFAQQEQAVNRNLYLHIQKLAGEIGERNIWHYNNLQKAADYIALNFDKAGYQVKRSCYEFNGKAVQNIEAELPVSNQTKGIIIIGAHYDSVSGSPGADDNASGVAIMLEIARLLSQKKFKYTLRFIAFANEEPPFFQTDSMGSNAYAKQAKQQHENIIAMLSLESLGYYLDTKNSQAFPLPVLKWFYPHQGNFVGLVSNFASRKLLKKIKVLFNKNGSLPVASIVAPEALAGVGWSDQWSFWQQGYPAMMITDTALFRNPYYHTREDTPDKINYCYATLATDSLAKVIAELADANF